MKQEIENTYPPTLYAWAGGEVAFRKLIDRFYEKVLLDDVLKHIFKHMSKDHQEHVANFIIEVLGGPKFYTDTGKSHFEMVKKHLGKHLNEMHRKQFVKLLLEAADETGLPEDPEFRSAFVGYLEWGTRLAVINSKVEQIDMDPNEPMPEWGWGVVGGPYQD